MSDSDSNQLANTVAIASLIIAIIAFVVAIAQALQQYLSSAEGYRKCAAPVMGLWARATRRRFRWSEVRFEVLFETPVLFIALPINERGPIPGRKIYNLDGSSGSYADSRTLSTEQQKANEEQKAADEEANADSKFKRVHTVDDERASWVNLLATIQEAESHSRAWDKKYGLTPKGIQYEAPKYDLVVQMQARKRSWDYMPDSVLKPYAMSTVSHIAELAVMLGMHWKAFDPDSWNLRAEGNGLVITSSNYQGLGLGVSFSVYSSTTFKANRVIPCDAVKQYTFGEVPTIFDKRNLGFGSDQDIRRTLQFLGCREDVIKKFYKRHEHVRSVLFETIGMIGAICRIRGSNFKMLPNPTRDVWDKVFSACELTTECVKQLRILSKRPQGTPRADALLELWTSLKNVWRDNETQIDIDMREAAHDILNECDSWLLAQSQSLTRGVVGSHISVIVKEVNNMESILTTRECDEESELMPFFFERVLPEVGNASTATAQNTPVSAHPLTPAKRREREDIWITLMFRMCVWWLIHDFDKGDVIVLPPRLKGSRLPIYII